MPSWIMLPHDGVGGWMPTPRNDSALSSRMLPAIDSVANTISGPTRFGSRWRSRIARVARRRAPAPPRRSRARAGQHLGADDAREVGPVHERQDQHHHPHAALAQHRRQRDREQQHRDRHHGVDEARDHGVDQPAVVARRAGRPRARRPARAACRASRPAARRARRSSMRDSTSRPSRSTPSGNAALGPDRQAVVGDHVDRAAADRARAPSCACSIGRLVEHVRRDPRRGERREHAARRARRGAPTRPAVAREAARSTSCHERRTRASAGARSRPARESAPRSPTALIRAASGAASGGFTYRRSILRMRVTWRYQPPSRGA